MISVKEALEIILKEISPLGVESAGALASLGRVLAQDITAARPNPPWDNSAMDGYALRSADVANASPSGQTMLKVIYDLPAGQVPKGPVGRNQAVRIMTGAPIPEGADAVVMVENTESAGKQNVFIRTSAKSGENIRRAGEDFKVGELVVRKGSLIRAAEISMFATVGVPEVKVHKRPVVSVLSTGDELVEINEVPSKGKIINSNSYALSALVMDSGAEYLRLGIARDTKESLKEKLSEAMKADCIITSGGVSVGAYDFVKDALREMGSAMRFWQVAIKPGKPLAFGVIGGKPAFGLPGNPISSMVSFEEFVRPALLKMAGRRDIFRKSIRARLTKDIKIKPGRMNFIRSELTLDADGFCVTPLEGQGSGVISTMVRSNSFVIVPEDSPGYKKDELIPVQPFDASILFSDKPVC